MGTVEVHDDVRSHRGQWLQRAVITELPLRKWTEDYRNMLRRLVADGKVANVKEHHSESTVHFELDLAPEDGVPYNVAAAARLLKLHGSLSTSNMHAVDVHGSVLHLDGPMDVFAHSLGTRHELYKARLQLQAAQLATARSKYANQVRFIKGVISGKYAFGKRSLDEIASLLKADSFTSFDSIRQAEERERHASLQRVAATLGLAPTAPQLLDESRGEVDVQAFKYLLELPISSMSRDKVQQLESKLQQADADLQKLGATSAARVWLDELDALERGVLVSSTN